MIKKLIVVAVLGCESMVVSAQATSTPLSHPDFSFFQSQLEKKNEQYEVGNNAVNAAFFALMDVKLINKINQRKLTEYRERVMNQSDRLSNVDYSLPANVESALAFINSYQTNQSIREEMYFLTKISSEMSRMAERKPDTWTESPRYKELQDILTQLVGCDPNDIRTIMLRHGIF